MAFMPSQGQKKAMNDESESLAITDIITVTVQTFNGGTISGLQRSWNKESCQTSATASYY
jgi:hypothetical protein